jgi:hypothetical protein
MRSTAKRKYGPTVDEVPLKEKVDERLHHLPDEERPSN